MWVHVQEDDDEEEEEVKPAAQASKKRKAEVGGCMMHAHANGADPRSSVHVGVLMIQAAAKAADEDDDEDDDEEDDEEEDEEEEEEASDAQSLRSPLRDPLLFCPEKADAGGCCEITAPVPAGAQEEDKGGCAQGGCDGSTGQQHHLRQEPALVRQRPEPARVLLRVRTGRQRARGCVYFRLTGCPPRRKVARMHPCSCCVGQRCN